VRELLVENPGRAREIGPNGITPLWWLPDDEAKAMEAVELLLAAGADPSLKSTDGRTAADWARRRGMIDVAARLDRAVSVEPKRR
jgi:ankyrin repeat protein